MDVDLLRRICRAGTGVFMAHLYTHRLKALLEDLVEGLGLQLALSDRISGISLRNNLAALEAAAGAVGVEMTYAEIDGAIEVVFSPKS